MSKVSPSCLDTVHSILSFAWMIIRLCVYCVRYSFWQDAGVSVNPHRVRWWSYYFNVHSKFEKNVDALLVTTGSCGVQGICYLVHPCFSLTWICSTLPVVLLWQKFIFDFNILILSWKQEAMPGSVVKTMGAEQQTEERTSNCDQETTLIHGLSVDRYRQIYNSVLQPSVLSELSKCKNNVRHNSWYFDLLRMNEYQVRCFEFSFKVTIQLFN